MVNGESEQLEIQAVFNFNAKSEFNLRVTRVSRGDPQIDAHTKKLYDALQNHRLVFADNIGYFVICNVQDGYANGLDYKDIKMESCEREIEKKNLTYIQDGTYRFIDLLETIVSTLPRWTIGSVDSAIREKYRTFQDVDPEMNTLSFFLTDMQEAYECIFQFDIINRRIHVYDQNNYAVWTASTSYSNNTIAALGTTTRSSASAGSYRVTFSGNGGACSTGYLDAARTTSYSFAGWGTTGSSGVNLSSGSAFYSNTTVYAQWGSSTSTAAITLPAASALSRGNSSSNFTITGDGNGGASKSITATKTTSYTPSKWSTAASGGTTYSLGASYTPSAAVTLYAQWDSSDGYSNNTIAALGSTTRENTSAGSYSVAFDSAGGNATPSTLYAARTTSYTFLGWGSSASAGSNLASTTAYTAAATVYARWSSSTTTAPVTLPTAVTRNNGTAAGYAVAFNGNGGTPGVDSLRATNTIQYTFANWQGYAAGSSYTPTGDATLVAAYNAKTVLGSITLPNASRSGYTLLGWAADPAATSGATGSYTPSGDVTLYAIWEPSGLIRIYDGSAWRNGLVWVFDGTVWRQGIPWVYDGTAWKMGG